MMFYGWSPDMLRAGINSVSHHVYSGNLRVDIRHERETRNGWRVSAVLRVNSSRGIGARRSCTGRRTVAANWAAHRDVMHALFMANPEGRISSMLADYRGFADFERKFRATADHNAGSIMQPARFGDL